MVGLRTQVPGCPRHYGVNSGSCCALTINVFKTIVSVSLECGDTPAQARNNGRLSWHLHAGMFCTGICFFFGFGNIERDTQIELYIGKLLPGALKHRQSRVSLAIWNDLQFNLISGLHMNTTENSEVFGPKMGIFQCLFNLLLFIFYMCSSFFNSR